MKIMKVFVFSVLITLISVSFAYAEATPTAAPPNLPGASMWIPWSDFKEILDRLSSPQTGGEELPPPVEAVIGNADYLIEVRENGVSVDITAQVLVLKKNGWASVPVINAMVPLASASLDGKPMALASGDGGMLDLVVAGLGEHTLKLTMILPREAGDGAKRLSIPTIRSQVNHLDVRIGQPDLQVKLEPSNYLESKTVTGATVATGSFIPTDSLEISWVRKVNQTEMAEARVSAEVRTMLTVGEGLGIFTSIIDYEILHKPISRFSLLLPADVSVVDVTTEGLVEWKVIPKDQQQELSVEIAFDAMGKHQLAVTYEKAIAIGEATTIPTADVVLRDVVHEVGYLAVAVRTNVQVSPKAGSLQNLAQIDTSELPGDLRGSSDLKVLHAYKYFKHPATLELEVVKHQDASVLTCEVESASYKVMITNAGKQLIEGTFVIANRSLQYLSLKLPPDTELWGVYRDDQPIKAAQDDNTILLPVYREGERKTFTIKVLAYRKTGSFLPIGARHLELPMIGAGASRLELTLYLPQRYAYFGFNSKLTEKVAVPTETSVVSDADYSGGDVGYGNTGGVRGSQSLQKNDRNMDYRVDNSQVPMMQSNEPASSITGSYSNAMTRGTLPVQFDVNWEGVQYEFSTRIVDPDEKLSMTFFYNRKSQARLLWWLLLLSVVYLGYWGTHWWVAKKSTRLNKPRTIFNLVGLSVVILIILLSMIRGVSVLMLFFGLIVGAVGLLLRWRSSGKHEEATDYVLSMSGEKAAKPDNEENNKGGEQ